MRVLLALVAMAGPAFAGEPAAVEPPPGPAPAPTPPSEPQPTPPPPVDPAYGERPDRSGSPGTHSEAETGGHREIVVRYHPDRSRDNITKLAVTGGVGLLFGVLGLYYHFDARSATDEVASNRFTGETWSVAHEDLVDQAERSSMIAGISYGIGGGLLIATAVLYIVTEPKLETQVIRPHTTRPPVAIVPVRGGAVVGGGWSF